MVSEDACIQTFEVMIDRHAALEDMVTRLGENVQKLLEMMTEPGMASLSRLKAGDFQLQQHANQARYRIENCMHLGRDFAGMHEILHPRVIQILKQNGFTVYKAAIEHVVSWPLEKDSGFEARYSGCSRPPRLLAEFEYFSQLTLV